MKFGLINTYSYNNVGDAAIYAALSKMLDGHEVYSTLLDNQPVAQGRMAYSTSLQHCDGFVSVGGDIFNNSRPWFITKNFLNNLAQLKKNPEATFLFGQSIPRSCRGLALGLLCDRLKQINSVTVRDQESFDLLTSRGVDCRLSYDSAFVLECSHDAVKLGIDILAALHAENSAVISLREFNPLYPVDNKNFVNNIAKLCRLLSVRHYQPVLVIQSSVSSMDSDWVIANAIRELCPEAKILDLVKYESKFPSWELLQAILKIAPLAVAVRYHTAVLAMAAGRTPYNLYYSNKGEDLSKRLGIPGGPISNFNPDREIDLIIKNDRLSFNSEPVRQQVKTDFDMALTKCLARASAIRGRHAA